MAPTTTFNERLTRNGRNDSSFGNWRDMDDIEAFILEGWGQGFMFGALLIMSVITVANMKKGILLHKLILLELLLAMSHGTFCFMSFHGYGYYLSSTAALLYCSYFTHNVVAWLKIKPFFTGTQPFFGPKYSKWVSRIYLSTLALTIPALIFEIYNNFRFFNNISRLYATVRPYEPLMRDPWWLFSCITLFHVISKSYSLKINKLVRRSPRFGIMLVAIFLAICFTIVDILSTIIRHLSITDGINPYWKLALVFKCLTDNILLDDFKSVLQKLGAMKVDEVTHTATFPDSVYLSKVGSSDHRERLSEPGSHHRRDRPSFQTGDQSSQDRIMGDENQDVSRSSNAVGRLGIKINKLPKLPFSTGERKGDSKPKAKPGELVDPGNLLEDPKKQT